VCKQWCDLAYPIIWQRPAISRLANLAAFARVLLAPTTTQPYAEAVRRINLSHVLEEKYGDEIFMALKKCTKTERMTPGPKSDPSSKAMSEVFRHMPNLCAVDLSHMRQVDDPVVKALAETCSGLQGLNVTMCRLVGDEAISLLADKCKNLRRVSPDLCEFS
jgi:F-box and leucine-rich repeat protein GRR1